MDDLEVQDLRRKLQELSSQVETLTAQRNAEREESLVWKRKHQGLSNTFTDKLMEFKAMKQSHHHMEDQLRAMRAATRDMESLHQFCMDEKAVEVSVITEQYQSQYDVLKERIKELEACKEVLPSDVESELLELRATRAKLTSDLDDALAKHATLSAELAREKANASNAAATLPHGTDLHHPHSTTSSTMKEGSLGMVETLTIRNDLLREDNANLKSEISKLKDEKTELLCTVAELNVTIEVLKGDVEEKQSLIARATLERDEAAAAHAEHVQVLDEKHQSVVSELHEQLSSLERALEIEKDASAKLSSSVDEAKAAAQRADEQCQLAKDREDAAQSKSESLSDLVKQLRNDLRLQHKKHHKEVELLREEFSVGEYKSRYAEAVADKLMLEKKVVKLMSLLACVKALAKSQRTAAAAIQDGAALVDRQRKMVADQHENARNQVDAWRGRVDVAEAKALKLQAHNASLLGVEHKLESTMESLAASEARVTRQDAMLSEQRDLVTFLQDEGMVAHKMLDERSAQYEGLLSAHHEATNRLQESQKTCEALNKDVEEARAKVDELRSMASEQKAAYERLRGTSESQNTSLSDLEETCARLREELASASAACSEAQRGRDRLESECAALTTQGDASKDQLAALGERCAGLEDALNASQGAATALAADLAAVTEAKMAAENTCNALQLDLGAMEAKAVRLERHLSAVERSRDVAEQSHAAAEKARDLAIAQLEEAKLGREEALLEMELLLDVAGVMSGPKTARMWEDREDAVNKVEEAAMCKPKPSRARSYKEPSARPARTATAGPLKPRAPTDARSNVVDLQALKRRLGGMLSSKGTAE